MLVQHFSAASRYGIASVLTSRFARTTAKPLLTSYKQLACRSCKPLETLFHNLSEASFFLKLSEISSLSQKFVANLFKMIAFAILKVYDLSAHSSLISFSNVSKSSLALYFSSNGFFSSFALSFWRTLAPLNQASKSTSHSTISSISSRVVPSGTASKSISSLVNILLKAESNNVASDSSL